MAGKVRRMSAKEYQEMLCQTAKKRKPKYSNRFVYIYGDGFVSNCKTLATHGPIERRYDSEKEYVRHKELELLERGGRISGLRWQVPILLQDAFRDSAGNKIQAIYYIADFTYDEGGQEVVEDVKGINKYGRIQTTEAFRLKWKLLKAKYPDKEFRIY